MMTTYVYRPDHPEADEHGMVDKELAYSGATSGSFNVISDEMPATRHMADGRVFTSKSKFRAHTRAHGCVEVGNDTSALLKPRKRLELSREARRLDIRRAIEQLR